MRPLSRVLPKPALPIPNHPVVASAIRLAAVTGTHRVVVNTWHLADVMEQRLDEIEPATAVTISRETKLMGTAGGIALARERGYLGERGPVLIINGDGLLNLDLTALFHRMSTADDLVTLALLPHPDPRRWSRIVVNHHGRVTKIRKPGTLGPGESPLLYPGVMLVARKALNSLPEGTGDIPGLLWGPAMAEGRLGGVPVSGHWREIGTPSDYLEAVLGRIEREVLTHPTAEIHPSATIGSALIGRNATIEAGAVIGSSIVAEGATVQRGAQVFRSVLLGDVSAAADEKIVDDFWATPFQNKSETP